MPPRLNAILTTTQRSMIHLLSGPQALAFLPTLVLCGFWLGGEAVLMVFAIGLPACLLLITAISSGRSDRISGMDTGDDVDSLDSLEAELDKQYRSGQARSRKTACLILEVDNFKTMLNQHGQDAVDHVMQQCCERIRNVIRERDNMFTLTDGQIAITTTPVQHLDHDICLQLAIRLQNAVEDPITLDATTVYISVSAGFSISTQVGKSGADMADAAFLALSEARRHAPSAIRSYEKNLKPAAPCAQVVVDEIETALNEEQIIAWYQPQISTDTGRVTGMEVLARWEHPTRGLISPAEFLPAIEQASKCEHLGEVMLNYALSALKTWDKEGVCVPQVGVNFTPEELRNPRLTEKVSWTLDRFDLPPSRLAVEILETVVATSPEDTISRNIRDLAKLGCQIDLDDFGTGHASISSIRRFAINRLKIDRSFIMKVDQDPEQQRMISAILLMAEQLNLETLAEGVETTGEHTMLAQLGCGHIQGFGIGRPMPFEITSDWVRTHHSKLQAPPPIGRKTG